MPAGEMFTEGLDENGRQWVYEGMVMPSSFPTICRVENLSPNLPKETVYPGRLAGKGWQLPQPTQLGNVHLHSGMLRPTFGNESARTIDDLEESVGSISEKVYYDDCSDTGDEQESFQDSSPSLSPRIQRDDKEGNGRHYIQETKWGGHENGHNERSRYEDIYVDTRTWQESLNPLDRQHQEAWPDVDIHVSQGNGQVNARGTMPSRPAPVKQVSGGESSDDNGSMDDHPPNLRNGQQFQQNGAHYVQASVGSSRIGVSQEHVAMKVEESKFEWVSSNGHPYASTVNKSARQSHEHKANHHTAANAAEGSQFHARWASDTNLHYHVQKEEYVDSVPPRSNSDSAGMPPSAPPMVGHMVAENSSGTSSISTHKPSVKAFSYNIKEINYSGPMKPFENIPNSSLKVEPKVSEPKITPRDGARLVDEIGVREEAVASKHGTALSNQTPSLCLSGQAAWQALIAYDACVRLCLRAWARGCMEAPEFLQDECSLLRNSFGLQQFLLQPQEEVSKKGASGDSGGTSTTKTKRNVGKVKVQVRKVKLMMKMPPGCQFSSLAATFWHVDSQDKGSANKHCPLLEGWSTVRKIRILPPRQVSRSGSLQGNNYLNAGAQYMRQVSGILKAGVNTLRNSTLAESQDPEVYACILKLKNSTEDEAVRLQPGCGDTSVLLLESVGDDLLLEVQDSKGTSLGRVTIQLASITDDPNDRVRWWPVYSEPEHECIGKVQLFISYTLSSSEVGSAKWGAVGETVAYDIVLDVAMKVNQFQRRKLHLHGSWQWLLSEFACYYGVSDIYTKLRYLACIMDVATPTGDCLTLIYELLCPIIKSRDENSLNRQEKRILADVEEQISQLLALTFENYKSLDDTSPTGLPEVFLPACGTAAAALVPAVQIYTLLNDILSLEAQAALRNFFQTAARKRCKRHMSETDEFVSSSSEGFLMDPLTLSTAYLKMKNLCVHIGNEVNTDIQIHNQHVLPSSIDLPNITAGIYSVELCNRLRSFLVACPPSSPSPPVADLLIATADFERDLTSWGIRHIKGGVDARELFHLYIVLWIQEKRLQLLEFCKFDKVRLAGVTTQHGTAPFVEEVYERIKETLKEYEVVVGRWPEYTFVLENAVADVERAVIAALEKHYADVLVPLKEVMIPKKFSLQYMQKLARRKSLTLYSVPNQLGVVLNTIKRLLDTLRPNVEAQMRAWVACLPVDGSGSGRGVFGERLNDVTVALRTKYKNLLQAIVEKLADNARMQHPTKLKKILQDTREAAADSEMRERMQPLNTQLLETISHLHEVFTTCVFVAVCRGYWDRMARDILHFLENRKENKSWYKSSCFALGILDDIFASQMQRLQGHALGEKDLEPPRSVMEARSMLSRDARNGLDSSSYLF